MPEILNLAQSAFSTAEKTVTFPTLLPKLYGPDAQTATQHLVLRVDGAIRAMLCTEILTICVDGSLCKAGYIGTVAVDKAFRGRGYMQALLSAAQQKFRQEGCAFGVLGGQRQRYEYFGFEPAGCAWNFNLTRDNVRHACRGAQTVQLAALSKNSTWLQSAAALHNGTAIHCRRSEQNFYSRLCSWQAEPFAIVKNEQFLGYCSISFADDSVCVQEISLAEPAYFPDFCNALFEHIDKDRCNIVLPALADDAQRFFASVCENVFLSTNHSFTVYDWCAALEPFFKLHCARTPLNDTVFYASIQNADAEITLQFCVKDNVGTVCRCAAQESAVAFSALEALQVFFSPHTSLVAERKKIPAQLFPLPLFVPAPDSI